MNTANKITLARVALIPIFMVFLLIEQIPFHTYIALGLFIFAAATDGIDGYVARKYNQITTFGKFIDPLADKLLITAALVGLVELGYVAAWLAVVIIAREFAVTGLRTVAVSSGKVIAASASGKLKTVVQIVAICIVTLVGETIIEIGSIRISGQLISDLVMWLAVIITLYSGMEYIVKNWSIIDYSK